MQQNQFFLKDTKYIQFTKMCLLNILNVINYVYLMSLLNVSATHGPSSGNKGKRALNTHN
jgi:hypothetical protein